jgi:Spy/CpxP family protein refolding chaperone
VKRNWLLYLVIFALALNLGTIGTFAYLRHQDQPQPQAVSQALPPPPVRPIWRELNLDASQRQTLRGLFPEHHQRVRAIRQQLAQKRQELFNLIQDDRTPWSAIRAKVQEISALQGSLEIEMARFMLEFKKNLNPAQQATFLNMVQTRLGCGPPRGVCGPGGPGGRGPGMMGPGMGPGMGHRGGPMRPSSD